MQRLPAGDAFNLRQRLFQGVTIKGIAVQCIDSQNPVSL
jgi:hypothetical protein